MDLAEAFGAFREAWLDAGRTGAPELTSPLETARTGISSVEPGTGVCLHRGTVVLTQDD